MDAALHTSTDVGGASCSSCGRATGSQNLVVCIDSDHDGDKNSVLASFLDMLKESNGSSPEDSSGACCRIGQLSYYNVIPSLVGNNIQRKPPYQTEAPRIDRESSRMPVRNAYHWLCRSYNEGDYIYLLGSRRGSREAYVLAGMIRQMGLIYQGNEHLANFAYEIYLDATKKNTARNMDVVTKFKNTFSRADVRIHFVGTWDTISFENLSEAKAYKASYLRTGLFDSVNFCSRAVSLDERWMEFLLAQWGQEWDGKKEKNSVGWLPKVKEVIFVGAHNNYFRFRQTSRTRYRPFSLDWMVHQAKAAGLRITTPSSIAERVPRLLIFPEGRSSPCPDWSLNIMSKFYNPVSYIKSKAVVERRHKSNKYGSMSRLARLHLTAFAWCTIHKQLPRAYHEQKNLMKTWPDFTFGSLSHSNLDFDGIDKNTILQMISELNDSHGHTLRTILSFMTDVTSLLTIVRPIPRLPNERNMRALSSRIGTKDTQKSSVILETLRMLSTTEFGLRAMIIPELYEKLERMLDDEPSVSSKVMVDVVDILTQLLHNEHIIKLASRREDASFSPERLHHIANALKRLLDREDPQIRQHIIKILRFILQSPWLRDEIDHTAMRDKLEKTLPSAMRHESTAGQVLNLLQSQDTSLRAQDLRHPSTMPGTIDPAQSPLAVPT